jgi:imidazoleglycerol phosphate dehydratase HisB
MRTADITRKTRETNITVHLNLDGMGECDINTGIPFLDHMLHSMGRHGRIDLSVHAVGDLKVDAHHTVEDTGIVIGDAVREAIREGRGIRRFAHAIVPMDESLATVAMDCSGRGSLVYEGSFYNLAVGGIEADLFEHFFYSLCTRAGINVHLLFHGKNDHHQCEAAFKAFGIALGEATRITGSDKEIPSTKGTLR